MLPGIEYIKTCLNGLLLRITNLAKEIDKKISDVMDASKADWNQNDQDALNYVKNRPMYSYQENVGTEYSVSGISSNPLPLVFGEEWYVKGYYAGIADKYLPAGVKAILAVGKNKSGDLCIADSSYEFNTGSEASSSNKYVIYADHIYENASWKSAANASVSSVFRLAEPSYKLAYKTIDTELLPMANDATPGIVHPYFSNRNLGTEVVVNEDGRLYCDTELPVVNVTASLNIDLSFNGKNNKTFLMFYSSNAATNHIKINGSTFNIYVNGVPSSIPTNTYGSLFLALAQSSTKKLHLVKNPIT